MKVVLYVKSDRIAMFFELLANGILIKAPMGLSVRDFLCSNLHMDPTYVETRIQTIFLNGRALDDIDGATLADGAVMALSSAMPGLAGAVFRRGSAYAPLRSEVVAAPTEGRKTSPEGNIVLKLFNQVAADFGLSFLKAGIRVRSDLFSMFFCRSLEKIEKIITRVEVNGKQYPLNDLLDLKSISNDVCLTIETV